MTPPNDSSMCTALIQTLREPVLVLDGTLRITHASPAFYRLLAMTPGAGVGRRIWEIGGDAWKMPGLREKLEGVVKADERVEDFVVAGDFPGRGRRAFLVNARRVAEPGDHPRVLVAIEDVTEKRRMATEGVSRQQWFATALASIGDAVIATDTDASVTYMNPTAERLTGWKLEEAAGRPLLEVFNIINETSRSIVESPVTKSLRTGHVVGLANHTVLIARDGSERPIDDSAAPIRDEAGNVLGVVLVFRDITERRLSERARARLAEIVESSDDAIAAKDLNGIITAWNHGAEKLFGYTAEEAVGKSITIIIPPDRTQEEQEVLARIRRGEKVDHFETVRRRKDGTLVDISLTVSPLRDEHGEIIGASKIARDITERKRVQAMIEAHLTTEQALRIEAEAANRSKDLFLATLSHELRTPLNAIVAWIQILKSPNRTAEDLKEGVEVIERNTRVQMQLIEDVLDISRIVSGKLRLNIQRCEFAAILASVVEALGPTAAAKGIVIETVIDPEANAGTCDTGRLQQVVWNLMSNAIKFTPKGGRVRMSLDRSQSMRRIRVSDTGQGISPEFLPYVFDRFRQADSTSRRRFGGLGLGLSIVKQLVELHGGTVKAESEGEGKGAMFTVELPVAAVAETAVSETDGTAQEKKADAAKQTHGDPVRLDGLHVVIVDDEPDARRVLERLLKDAGASVTAAGSAAEALAVIERRKPEVLVSDLAMPEQDGLDLIRQVREKGLDEKALPAIALTAYADKGSARRALLAGFQVHVAKPVDPADLLAIVAKQAGRPA